MDFPVFSTSRTASALNSAVNVLRFLFLPAVSSAAMDIAYLACWNVHNSGPLQSDLRNEYVNSPVVKDAREVSTAYEKVKAAAKDPSAAGDLSLIFGYMKLLDPGSTVREGEFANAQNATGVPERILNQYNKITTGERLNPDQRADFQKQAEGLFDVHSKQAQQHRKNYTDLAGKAGLDPSQVVIDLGIGGAEGTTRGPTRTVTRTAQPNGKITVTKGSHTLVIDEADEAEAAQDGYRRAK